MNFLNKYRLKSIGCSVPKNMLNKFYKIKKHKSKKKRKKLYINLIK